MNSLRVSVLLCVLLLCTAFSLGVESTIDCPENMHLDEEAICTIDVTDVTDVYDVKIYVVGETGGVNQIFDGETFRRADWYVKGLVDEDGEYEIKIKIHKAFDGKATVQFKMRDSSSTIVLYQEFDMRISSERVSLHEEEEVVTATQETTINEEEEIMQEDEEATDEPSQVRTVQSQGVIEEEDAIETSKNVSKTIINLGGYEASEETVVYKSKTERIKDYFVYFFVLFLIVIVCFLLYERYGNRNRDY